jgi:hypothetical protein
VVRFGVGCGRSGSWGGGGADGGVFICCGTDCGGV